MRRVQVESPFAPRTPKVYGACRGCGITQDWASCDYCVNRVIRAHESRRHAYYLALCLRDCVNRGETPYASHALLTLPGALRDDVPEERERGIAAGFAMRRGMHATVIYVNCYSDFWRSGGMARGLADAEELHNALYGLILQCRGTGAEHAIELRRLPLAEWTPIEYKAA